MLDHLVDVRGDDYLHDIALLSWLHLHLGNGIRRCPRSWSARARHQHGDRCRARARHPHGQGYIIHHPLQRTDEAGALWTLGVSPWSEQGKTSPSERLVGQFANSVDIDFHIPSYLDFNLSSKARSVLLEICFF